MESYRVEQDVYDYDADENRFSVEKRRKSCQVPEMKSGGTMGNFNIMVLQTAGKMDADGEGF